MDAKQFYVELNRYLNSSKSGRRQVISKRTIRKEMDKILEKMESENMENEFVEVDKYKATPIFWNDVQNKYFVLNKYFTTKKKAKTYIEEMK